MDLIGLFSKTTGSLLGKKAGGNVRVDTALIKNLEDQTRKFSLHFEALLKSCRAYLDAMQVVTRGNSELVAVFAKATSKEVERNSNSNTGTALSHFTEHQRKTALFYESLNQDLSITFCNFLTNNLKTDLKANLTALKSRFEKALDSYDQAIAKSKELRSAKKPDLSKIFASEKELVRLKRTFEDAFDDYVGGMTDLVERLNYDLLELLIEIQSSEKSALKRNHDLHLALDPYLTQLKSYCESQQQQFDQGLVDRDQQIQSDRRRAAYDRYVPFVELTQADDYLVIYIMFNVANENPPSGWNFPASVLRIWRAYGVDVSLEKLHPAFAMANDNLQACTRAEADEIELPRIQEFTRTHYGKVCTNLLLMDRKELVFRLIAVLGELNPVYPT